MSDKVLPINTEFKGLKLLGSGCGLKLHHPESVGWLGFESNPYVYLLYFQNLGECIGISVT